MSRIRAALGVLGDAFLNPVGILFADDDLDRYEQLEALGLFLNCQNCTLAFEARQCDVREARSGAVVLACPQCHGDLGAFTPS